MKKLLAFLLLFCTTPAFAGNTTFDSTAANSITDASVSISDITTNNTSTSAHGFYPKLPAIPTFVALGASAHGTGALSVSLPTGHTTNDILLCFVQSSNEVITAPSGYAQLGPQPGYGIAATALSNRLAIFWKRDGGSETDPITVNDSGDHTFAYMIAIRGCTTTGDPFQYAGDGFKITASVTGTATGYSTFAPNSLIVVAFATGIDGTAAVFSSWTNASLGSVTERGDDSTTDGTGGGIGVATGTLAVAGPFGNTTVTETSTSDAFATFAMLPNNYDQADNMKTRPAEIQTFCSRGTDTWTKPTNATRVFVQAIGGGGSGSSGRNAATAEGGGGGGGAMYTEREFRASDLAATVTTIVGAGGAVSADSDGASGNDGVDSQFGTFPGVGLLAVKGKTGTATVSADGGNGGAGGGTTVPSAATLQTITASELGTSGGNGSTTAVAGSPGERGGGGGENGADSDAAVGAGLSKYGGGGGGGGRSSGTITSGGSGGGAAFPTAVAGASGTDSGALPFGGSGGCSGNSGTRGGSGGYPGAGGGGGGTGSGTQGGGKGGDGCVVVTTYF